MEGAKLKQPAEQPQVIYIDGCRVTIKYSGLIIMLTSC